MDICTHLAVLTRLIQTWQISIVFLLPSDSKPKTQKNELCRYKIEKHKTIFHIHKFMEKYLCITSSSDAYSLNVSPMNSNNSGEMKTVKYTFYFLRNNDGLCHSIYLQRKPKITNRCYGSHSTVNLWFNILW